MADVVEKLREWYSPESAILRLRKDMEKVTKGPLSLKQPYINSKMKEVR